MREFATKRRALSLLLCAVLVLGMLPVPAQAAEGEPCTHTYENGVCTVCQEPCAHAEYSEGKCTVCGQAEPAGEPEGTVCTTHTYENGKCTVCGADQPADTQPEETQTTGGEQHAHTFKTVYSASETEGKHTVTVTCETCSDLNEVTEEAHTYVEGTCACGAVEPAHEHTRKTSYSASETEGKHTVTVTCETCSDLNEVTEEAHTYVEGTCACGAVEPAHEHTRKTSYSASETEGKHTVTVTCETCSDLNEVTEADHAYVDGVCVCGAEEPVQETEKTVYPGCAHHDHDEDCGGLLNNCTYVCETCVTEIQAMVDALPAMNEINEENKAQVGESLTAIQQRYILISTAAMAEINFLKFEQAALALTYPNMTRVIVQKSYVNSEDTPQASFTFINTATNTPVSLIPVDSTVAVTSAQPVSNGAAQEFYLPAGTYTVVETVEGDWDMTMTVNGVVEDDYTFTAEPGGNYGIALTNSGIAQRITIEPYCDDHDCIVDVGTITFQDESLNYNKSTSYSEDEGGYAAVDLEYAGTYTIQFGAVNREYICDTTDAITITVGQSNTIETYTGMTYDSGSDTYRIGFSPYEGKDIQTYGYDGVTISVTDQYGAYAQAGDGKGGLVPANNIALSLDSPCLWKTGYGTYTVTATLPSNYYTTDGKTSWTVITNVDGTVDTTNSTLSLYKHSSVVYISELDDKIRQELTVKAEFDSNIMTKPDVTVQLLTDNVAQSSTVTLSSSNGYEDTFIGLLPSHNTPNETDYDYKVQVTGLDTNTYQTSITGDEENGYTIKVELANVEAKWGTDADNLTYSGTLAAAVEAAEDDASIKYIQLQKSVEPSEKVDIRTEVTFDLNGHTLKSTADVAIAAYYDNANLTITGNGKVESSEMAVISSNGAVVTIQNGTYHSENGYAVYGAYASVTINGGSFTTDADVTVSVTETGTGTINGGSFTAGNWCAVGTSGSLTIKGAPTFNLNGKPAMYYWDGTVDLSGMTDPSAVTIKARKDVANLHESGNEILKLPSEWHVIDPDKNVTTCFKDQSTYSLSKLYSVTIPDTIVNATVSADPAINIPTGKTVTLTVIPDADYKQESLSVTDASNNPIQLTGPNDDGEYTFTMPASDVSVTATFTEKVTSLSLDKDSITLDVNETGTLTATVVPAGETVTWTSADKTVATVDQSGKVTAVKGGTATITATAGGKSDTCAVHVHDWTYTADGSTNTIKVECATSDCAYAGYTVTLNAPTNLTYDGSSKDATLSGADSNKTTSAVTAPTVDNIKYNNVSRTGYTGEDIIATLEWGGKSVSVSYSIAKATPKVTEPTAKTLTYTGEPLELINAGSTTGGTMVYSLTEDGEFTANIPKGTDATSYTVYWKVDGGTNYNDTEVKGPVNVTIDEATIGYSVQGETTTYDGQPHSITVTVSNPATGATITYSEDGVSYRAENYTYTDAGEYTVYYKITAENYTDVSSSETVAIYRADISPEVSIEGWTYGDTPKTPSVTKKDANNLESDGAVTYTYYTDAAYTVKTGTANGATTEGGVPTYAGTYYLHASIAQGTNHKAADARNSFTIAKKEIGITWTDTELTYNGQPQKPTATATGTEDGDEIALTVSGEQTDAGSYTATVTEITGDKKDNYKLPTILSTPFVIKNASQNAPVIGENGVQAVAETIDGKNDGKITGVDATMEYSNDGGATYTAVPADTTELTNLPDGEYKVRYAAKENYDASNPLAVTISAGKKLTVSLPTTQTGYTLTFVEGYTNEVSWEEEVKVKFELAPGYSKTTDFAVTSTDGTTAVAVTDNSDGTYTISNITANITVSVAGVVDNIAPDVHIIVSPNKWMTFLDNVTFGLFFKETQTVEIKATDAGSGVDKTYYYLSSAKMTMYEVKALAASAWTEYTGTFSINPDNKYVVYAKSVDKEGNSTIISSDGLVLDKTAPVITGVTNGATYYTTQKITATDSVDGLDTLDYKKLNDADFDGTIPGNTTAEYTIKAADKSQNTTEYTIRMLPISTLDDTLPTETAVKPADKDAIQAVKDKVTDILNNQSTNATDDEKKELQKIIDQCDKLLDMIKDAADVTDLIDKLPKPSEVEPDKKETIDAYEQAKDAYDKLPDSVKDLIDADTKKKLEEVGKALVAYDIIHQSAKYHTKGSGKTITFTANGYFGKFVSVEVDGLTVDPKNYDAEPGSTVITLKTGYLDSLTKGRHYIRVVYTDGETDGTDSFRVTVKNDNPFTGDNTNLMLYGGAAAASLLCMAMMLLFFPGKKGKYQY